mmetsp:Transcript_5254/g.7192  ORF Transcript_5254/g.7192 Transcript_5254/m.7192 type:complete len:336 (-) Transcript_5254:139-1146(-)
MPIPFTRKYEFSYAKLETLTPLIRRITARNPSSYTFHGTGTYIVGQKDSGLGLAVIDPGPMLEEHITALQELLKGEQVTHILITHTHTDHSPAAKVLKEYWGGVKTYGYGPHGSGRSATTRPGGGGLSSSSSSQRKEEEEDDDDHGDDGADLEFTPDVTLRDGDIIHGHNWTMEAVYTPGHTSNHLCFALKEENALFTGDHVMGWSTSVILPPDGNMTDYMKSLDKLLKRKEDVYWPTHGTCIRNVQSFVTSYMEHRYERKEQIISCLKEKENGNKSEKIRIADMVPLIYKDLDRKLYGAAARSILASMIWMMDSGEVICDDVEDPGLDSTYRLV